MGATGLVLPLMACAWLPRVGATPEDYKGTEVVRWGYDKRSYKGALDGALPVVIEDSPESNWPAVKKWTPDALAKRLDKITNVYVSNSPHFIYYDNDKEEGSNSLCNAYANAFGWTPTHSTVDLDPSTFFGTDPPRALGDDEPVCVQPSSADGFQDAPPVANYTYYSGHLGKFPPDVLADLPERHWWRFSRALKNHDGSEYEAEPNVWMTRAGVVSAAHYDTSHNFFVVISGKKRIRLYQPYLSETFDVFPSSHPSWRQSRLRIDLGEGPPPAIDLIATAGEVVYIPPFWFHHIESLTDSVAISHWFESSYQLRAQEVKYPRLPFDRGDFVSSDPLVKRLAFLRFLRTVLQSFHEELSHSTPPEFASPTPVDLASHLLHNRHGFPLLECPMSNLTSADARGDSGFPEYARKIGFDFATLRPAGVQAMIMGDFVDDIAMWVARTRANVAQARSFLCDLVLFLHLEAEDDW